MRQIFLDTETTGLSPAAGHRVIEIGCIEMVNRKLTGRTFHYYLNPEREVDAGAFKVHGLSTFFLRDKPLFANVVTELMQFIEGAELIIHNAPFDVGFLNHELKKHSQQHGQIETYCTIMDTLVMARELHPGQRNSLDALCKRYEVDNSNRELHGALLDADLLAQVYLSMTTGQSQLFAEDEGSRSHCNNDGHIQANDASFNVTVIPATLSEQQTHQDYLSHLNNDDFCVWLSDDQNE